jgi:ABC-2 type transport system ATP-binding protein
MLEVERLCERVVFISGGKVVADGTADEVATRFGRDDLEGVFLHLAEASGAFPSDVDREAS